MRLDFVDRAKLGLCAKFLESPFRGLAFRCLNRMKANRVPIPGVDLCRAKIALRNGSVNDAVVMLREETRLHPTNAEAAALLESLTRKSAEAQLARLPAADEEVFRKIRAYTMLSEQRLLALYQNAKLICETDLPGNFAECGVAAGGSAALLA
jgi:hypothetical protein